MKRAGGGYDYSSSELNVALGRQGKQALEINAQEYPHTAAMDAKLRSPQVRAVYRKRKWIVEAPNGWVKSVLGFRQFSLRGGSLHGSSLNSKFVHNDSKLRESDL